MIMINLLNICIFLTTLSSQTKGQQAKLVK